MNKVCPCFVLCTKILFAECGHGPSTNAAYVCRDRKSSHWANSEAAISRVQSKSTLH